MRVPAASEIGLPPLAQCPLLHKAVATRDPRRCLLPIAGSGQGRPRCSSDDGAITWGILDRLLEDPTIDIIAQRVSPARRLAMTPLESIPAYVEMTNKNLSPAANYCLWLRSTLYIITS
jgi:hypothetical protein